MKAPDLSEYMTSDELINWAMDKIRLYKPKEKLTDHDIASIMRWIGICAPDTVITQDDFPFIRRMGIGLMLSVTLLGFPEYYVKYELAQFN
jgi:hypothetical protein